MVRKFEHQLGVILTPIFAQLFKDAERLLDHNRIFKATRNFGAHRSFTSRWCLRELYHAIQNGDAIDWQRYVEVYLQHRSAVDDDLTERTSFQLHEDGEAELEWIRRWIKENRAVYQIVSMEGKNSRNLPKVEILMIALQYVIDRETERLTIS